MAGKIMKPNALQKSLHRFAMLSFISSFFAPWLHHLDRMILERTKGNYSLAGVLGWPILEVTTLGAKTNHPHSIPLIGIINGRSIGLIASNFGRVHNPGWYYNLRANPECDVLFNGRLGKYHAREAVGEEYDHYWDMAVSLYAGYEKYRQRAELRKIPVMVLEPKK